MLFPVIERKRVIQFFDWLDKHAAASCMHATAIPFIDLLASLVRLHARDSWLVLRCLGTILPLVEWK
jgi:hypothetical protein